MTFRDLDEGTELELTFSPDQSKFNQHYRVIGESKILPVLYSGSISQDELVKNKSRGALVSGLNTYTAAALETASLALSFFSFDPSGNLLKFSQMMKIYCRFRFFNINFGAYLATYFEFSA